MLPKSLKALGPYLWRYRWGYAFGALCVLLTNAFAVLFPQLIGRLTNGFKGNPPASWDFIGRWFDGIAGRILGHSPYSDPRGALLVFSLGILVIVVAKGVFLFLTRWVLIGISRDVEYDLRNDLFRHLEGLSYSFYQRTRTGDIMARATNDLNAVRNLLGPAIMYSANTIVFTLAALAFMVRISPRLTLYAFAPLPAASIVVQYFGRRIHERFERIQAMFSDISAKVQENLSGARVVKAYAQEDAEIAAFETANQEYIRRSLRLVRLMGMLWPTLELLLGIAVVLVLWLGGREVLQARMDIGYFVAFTTFMIMLTWPVIALGWVINIFQRGTASMVRLNELLVEKPEIEDSAEAVAALRSGQEPPITGEVEFRGLTFGYGARAAGGNGSGPAAPAVLDNINLKIPAGTSLALVGPTGAGKTTLVNLIPRVYDATPGTVLIDGRPIRDYAIATLRQNIGFVPQETFLFSDSIRENIAFGTAAASDEEVRSAAEAANIAADIESFPDGYQTRVGERGITLSGGQKQRTAIARALIRNPKILILDDALSSVDTYTEEKILNHLRDVMKGRTTIFISHRVSTVRNADRIAVLHNGKIVEYGTHDELIARNGYYTDLYQKQLLEEELAESV